MLFIRAYRPRTPLTTFEYVDETKGDEPRKQKPIFFVEPCNTSSGQTYRSKERLTSLRIIENTIQKIVVLLAVLALLLYTLYKWNCLQTSEEDQREPQILTPCTWIDLTAVDNSSLYFTHYNVSVTVTPQTPCCKNTTLLIIVNSRPKHRKARRAIRDTWGSIRAGLLSDLNFRVVFLLGRSSKLKRKRQKRFNEEIHIYDDIILTNIVDTRANVSLKSTAMLHWVMTFCPHVKYVMKTDDDVYVNEQLLMKFANQLPPKNRSIFGYVIKNTLPNRDPMDRWYISKDLYPGKRYPSFALGSSYLMTSNVIQRLCMYAVMTPILPFEDVFLTGICAEKAGIRLIHHPEMNNHFPREFCLMKKSITMRHVKPQIMRYIWSTLREGNIEDCPTKETPLNITAAVNKM